MESKSFSKMAQDSSRVTGGEEGSGGFGVEGSTTSEGPFVVGFVAGALPVTVIPPRSARPLKTCMTSAG